MKYIILISIILFLLILSINFKGCERIKENFDGNLSTTIDGNKDTIESIKKKLNLIQSNTSNILKNSNTLLFNSQSDNKNYNQLVNKYNQNIQNKQEIDYDINKLKIFKLLQNLDEKELLSAMELVRSNMTDSQKQILDQYVNVSISGNEIDNSISQLNS
tara:strand:+ start:121 stop:600 length:480 start_codon:yes stop_codon:yes gene_type:complete